MSIAPASFSQIVRIGLGGALLFVLAVLFALGLPLVLVWPLWVAGALALAALVVSLPIFGVRRLIAGASPSYRPGASFLFIFVLSFALLVVIFAFPVYALAYLIDSQPSVLPLVTLTDGKKIVRFQGMQHVGSEGFYKSVVYDLHEALSDGYVLYYEGVQPTPGRPELEDWFNRFATDGGGELSESYKSLADVCGLKFQLTYFGGLSKEMATDHERHVAADVTYLDMKTELERLEKDEPGFEAAYKAQREHKDQGAGVEKAFAFLLSLGKSGTPDQKRVIGLACRGFFNYALGAQNPTVSPKERVILDFRNKKLAERINDAPQDKIYVTYGARHVPGIIADLKALNPAWRVVDVKWSRAMANPENLTGKLLEAAPADANAP